MWAKFYVNGELQRESTGETDRELAEKWLERRMRKVVASEETGQQFESLAMRKYRVDSALDAYETQLQTQGSLDAQAVSLLKKVREDFGGMPARAITPERIGEYKREKLKAGFALATVQRRLQFLRAALLLALENGRIARVCKFKLEKENNARQDCFDESQLAAMLKALPPHIALFTRWCSAVGQRKGEASALRWEMVRGDTLTIPAALCKNRTERQLPLVAELSEILAEARAARSFTEDGVSHLSEYIFHDGHGQRLYEFGHRDFRKQWNAARKAIGCTENRFHGLRRFAVSSFLDAGVTSETARLLSGHKTENMLERYQMEPAKRSAMAKALEANRARREQEQKRAAAASNVVEMRR